MNNFYLVAVSVRHGDGSPETWIIKRANRFNPFESRFLGKDGRFGNKYFTLLNTQEFRTKAEAEFVAQSLLEEV